MTDASVLAPINDTPPEELDLLAVALGRTPGEAGFALFGKHSAAAAPSHLRTIFGDEPASTQLAEGTQGYVDRALAFMEANLDLGEYPAYSNANWLTDWYGMGHVSWCAITVSRALIEGGFGDPDQIVVPGVQPTTRHGWAYCPYVEDDYANAGRWSRDLTDLEPGDLILYDWDDDGWPDHIGILLRVDADASIWVYEGNTDEGALRLKHRSLTYVRGRARPPYTLATPPTPPDQKEHDVSKGAFPREVLSGDPKREYLVPAIGGGFGWTKASVTYSATKALRFLEARCVPSGRLINDQSGRPLVSADAWSGRFYVDLEPGEEGVEFHLDAMPHGVLDLLIEYSDQPQ